MQDGDNPQFQQQAVAEFEKTHQVDGEIEINAICEQVVPEYENQLFNNEVNRQEV